ncbi:MAG TPA: prepilin-type N-terminal cleavage/methylation domain-containing protein [Mycetocola sp.]|nr:prepilin-type N-terminal cleavage/methylation domain-containing protein [Mycetocola sp.]
MRQIRSRFAASTRPEDGLTLVELVVALMVFAIIAVSVAYSSVAVLKASRNSQGESVAANLAAQEIDLARSAGDVFKLVDKQREVPVGGVTYKIVRSTNWVDSSGGDQACGAGGGVLQYKRVNVSVTWPGSNAPVRADTLVAPSSKINDPTKGTILVRVQDEDGIGVPGITVTAAPSAVTPNTAEALTVTPLPTDSQGCSYILKVGAGTYDVTVSKSGYISSEQKHPATAVAGVGPGLSSSAVFNYNTASNVEITYASNSTSTVPKLPEQMMTTFVNSYDNFQAPLPTLSGSLKGKIARYPYRAGYEIVVGSFNPDAPTCLAPDPTQWLPKADGAYGVRPPLIATAPGSAPLVNAPMGLVSVANAGSADLYLYATTAAPQVPGEPGCSVPLTYSFGQALKNKTTTKAALPYGSWSFTTSTSPGGTKTAVAGTALVVTPDQGTLTASIVTLDPRTVIP